MLSLSLSFVDPFGRVHRLVRLCFPSPSPLPTPRVVVVVVSEFSRAILARARARAREPVRANELIFPIKRPFRNGSANPGDFRRLFRGAL